MNGPQLLLWYVLCIWAGEAAKSDRVCNLHIWAGEAAKSAMSISVSPYIESIQLHIWALRQVSIHIWAHPYIESIQSLMSAVYTHIWTCHLHIGDVSICQYLHIIW